MDFAYGFFIGFLVGGASCFCALAVMALLYGEDK